MTFDHRSSTIRRADLDREIDTIRLERQLATETGSQPGIIGRARQQTGRALIAAGTALVGREAGAFRTHRA